MDFALGQPEVGLIVFLTHLFSKFEGGVFHPRPKTRPSETPAPNVCYSLESTDRHKGIACLGIFKAVQSSLVKPPCGLFLQPQRFFTDLTNLNDKITSFWTKGCVKCFRLISIYI